MSAKSLNLSIADTRERDKYLSCLQRLSKVMDVVQSDDFNVNAKTQEKVRVKLLEEVQQIFLEVGLKIFSETLFRMMIVPFQYKEKESSYATKVLGFFFAIIRDDKWDEIVQHSGLINDTVNSLNGSIVEDGWTEPFPVRVLRLCERYHPDSRTTVRQRIMQTVTTIIYDRISVNEIRRNLQMKIIRMLLTRMRDKSMQIRVLSARNLCKFLADGVPFQTQIVHALIDSMRGDPEHSVRAKIVSCIKITDETLEHVVERTGDPNAIVRACAIKRVSEEIKLASLSVEMREAILKANTTEDSPRSIELAINSLLESWLKCLKGDPCEFLRVLNVRKRSSLCRTALNSLYNQTSEEAFEKMSAPLLNDKRYPDESLCVESTFLWLYMYKRFHDDPYIYNKLSLPVNDMIDYITEYMEVVEEEGDLPIGDLEYRSCMLGDLLQILSFLPVEEGERIAILEFLPSLCLKKTLMDARNSALVMKLISVCSSIDDESNVIDLVNCLLDSDRPTVRKSVSKSASATSEFKTDLGSPTPLKIELGNLMHRRKKLERDRDVAVKDNDLLKAQSCQDEINELEEQIQKTKETIEEQISSSHNNSIADPNETIEEELWTYSNKTMMIVLSLVKANIIQRNKISDFSRTFFEMYAVKAVSKCRDHTVRAMALELMCVVALEFEEETSRTALYCLMALLRDNINVKVTALKCLYDLVLRYSFTKLGGFPEIQQVLMGSNNVTAEKIQINADDPASTLKSLLLSYIRNEEIRLVKVSVAGVLKLLFKKEMNSSRLITTFLINWAIPSQGGDAQIRFKDVGTMIPVYANMGENEAVEVGQCLLQAIKKTLMKIHSRAQGDELTPHPDIEKIITLIVKCTDPIRLTEFQRCYVAHEAIAIGALQELRNIDLTTEEKMQYLKLLKVLDLRHCPVESINLMIHTLSDVAETANRTINQTLRGFSSYLESIIAHEGESIIEHKNPKNTKKIALETVNSDSDNMDTD